MKKVWITVLAAALVLAAQTPALAAQTGYHEPYLLGFPDGSIRPEEPVTREQLAQILFRLLENAPEDLQRESAFCDLPRSRWSYEAVSALAGLGILTGGENGRFEPGKTVSGKALTVAMNMIAHTRQGETAYPALAAGWIREAAAAKPLAEETTLSRAALAALLNRLLERGTEAEDQMGSDCFWDNTDAGAWYYADVREASVPHEWKTEDRAECWTAVG